MMIHRSYRLRTSRFSTLVGLVFLFIGFGPLEAQERDRVFPVKGAAVTGKIVEKSRDRVVIEVRGNNQNFPSNEV